MSNARPAMGTPNVLRMYVALATALLAACLLALSLTQKQAEAAFPGQNGKIAYAKGGIQNYEILTMNADGTDKTYLTDNKVSEYSPAWSPNGNKLVYGRDGEIFKMKADGSNKRRLTEKRTQSYDAEPTWSADGSKIVYVRYKEDRGGSEIWIMDADGTNNTRLTYNPRFDKSPAFSPDGEQLAFASDRDGGYGIYVMAPRPESATNQPRRLTTTPNMSITRPDWSPDGARIAYVSGEDGNPDIHVMDADGTNKVQLTTYPFSDYDPAWSPDGTRITFVSFREGEGSRQIYVMDAVPESPLNRPVRLTGTLNASEETPDWQPLP